MPGNTGNAQQAGHGDSSSKGTDLASQQMQGSQGNSAKPGGAQKGTSQANLSTDAGHDAAQSVGNGNEPPLTRISLPQNGQFGVVVVGSTLQDQYPETSGIWGGRLVYSVYLRLGLAKNWILQYSLPSAADAAKAGNGNRIDAPWPYYLVRPTALPADAYADALMIHGYVNADGHFESPTFAFSPGTADAGTILAALKQWRFRPARQNGQIARVEVLLIIPLTED